MRSRTRPNAGSADAVRAYVARSSTSQATNKRPVTIIAPPRRRRRKPRPGGCEHHSNTLRPRNPSPGVSTRRNDAERVTRPRARELLFRGRVPETHREPCVARLNIALDLIHRNLCDASSASRAATYVVVQVDQASFPLLDNVTPSVVQITPHRSHSPQFSFASPQYDERNYFGDPRLRAIVRTSDFLKSAATAARPAPTSSAMGVCPAYPGRPHDRARLT
jgi:hypothetical protein